VASTNIRIVLLRPTHPGNIGGAARAMKNMGLASLTLVAPEQFPHPEATARAAGAADVLERARVCETLDDALQGCHLVIGASARERRIEWPPLAPPEGAAMLRAGARRGPVALLFGQERTGLMNEELDRCRFVVTVPTDPRYPSLNLACAVQILVYEIYGAGSRVPDLPHDGHGEPAATVEETRLFYHHLEQVLTEINFLDPANPRLLMRRLVRLFNRAELDRNELNILRGILTAVQRTKG
jgi:TrmH family RNA methyltransferase